MKSGFPHYTADSMKRLLAATLCAALVLLSPGLPAYQAVAADFSGKGKADAAPTPTPQINAPLSLPSSSLPGAGVNAGLPASQIPNLDLPANAVANAGGARMGLPQASLPASSISHPQGLAQSHGAPQASLSKPGENGSGSAGAGSHQSPGSLGSGDNKEGSNPESAKQTASQLSADLSDQKKDKATVLSWVFDRLRRKASVSLDEVNAGAPSRRGDNGLSAATPRAAGAKKPLIERVTGINLSEYNATEKAYILGQSAFMFGAAIYITSMPLLVKALAGTAADTGIVRMTHYWTLGLASLFAGEIVKRVPMKKVLVTAGVGRAAIYATIGGLALVGGLHWGLFVGLVGANALLVAHNHLVDMDAAGANKIFATAEKRKQAFRLYKTLRYSMLLVMPWVLGLGMDKLDSLFGAGTGPKAGFLAFAGMMGLTAWIYQTRLKMAVLDVVDGASTVAAKLSPRKLAGSVARFFKETPARNWATMKIIWGNKAVLIRTIMSTTEQFLEDALFFVVLPTFAVETLGAAGFGNGLVLSSMYLGGLVTSLFLVKKAPKLEKSMGAYKFVALLSVGAAAAVIPSVALWMVPSLWVVLPVVALMKFLLDPIQTQMQSLLQEAIDSDPKTKAHEENIFGLMTVFETLAAGAGGLAFTWIFKNAGATGVLTTALGANAPMKIVTMMLGVFSIVYLASLPFLKKQLAKTHPAVEPGPLNGKSIVIVGSYLPARSFVFENARRLGVEIILVDDPARREAALEFVKPENFIAAPVFDADKHDEIATLVSAFAQERKAAGKPVDGTLAFFDAYTVLNAKIADALGLPGHGVEPIANTKSKDKMREVLAARSDFAVQFRRIKTEDEAAAAFRDLGHGVLKPPRGAGSQFVAEIRTEEEARAQFRAMVAAQEKMRREDPLKAGRYSVGKSFGGALYEQFLDGPEVDIEIIVQDGQVKLMTVADNLPTEPPYFVETGDIYPSQLPAADQAALKAMAHEAVKVIGLKNGNIHLEAKMTSRGPRVIEINSRMGGDFVYHAMKQTWGVDLIELGLKAAAGLPIPDLTGLEPKAVVTALEKPVETAGTIESISPEAYEMQKDPAKYGLYRVEIAKGVGDRVDGPPYGLSEKPVNIQAMGKTYAEAKRNAEKALDLIKIKVRPKGAPADGVTRIVHPGRADLTGALELAARSIAARDREKAQAALETAAGMAAKSPAASQLVSKAREAAGALADGRADEARAAAEAALALAPAAEEALALVKLEANLKRLGWPAYGTALDTTPADDNRPVVAMLAPASVYKLSIAREGSRQAPQDFHLALDPSWFFQDTLPNGDKQLRLRKGLRYDENGRPTIVEYAEPRLVRFFDNYLTPSGNDRDDGVPLELGLKTPMSSSHQLENETNDKILTRILMAQNQVGVPATAAFLMPDHTLDLNLSGADAPKGVSATRLPQGAGAREAIRARISQFLSAYDGAEVVVKPSGPRFHSARGVRYFPRADVEGMIDHVLALSKDELMGSDGAVLVEQRLVPPAVYLRANESDGSGRFGFLPDAVPVRYLKASEIPSAGAKDRKDWNLRVLVARTPWGQAAVEGIFGRAGTWGIPTNGEPANPADAAAIVKFEDIVASLREQHGVLKTPAEVEAFRAALEATAKGTLSALNAREASGVAQRGALAGAFSDYLGLDVMVEVKDGKVVPFVIEVNDKDSGGQWQLDQFYPENRGAHSRERVAGMLQRAREDALRGKRLIIVSAGYSGKKFVFDRLRELGVKVVLVDKGLSGFSRVVDRLRVALGFKSRDNWARGMVSEFVNVDTSKRDEALAALREKLRDSARKNGKIEGIATFWEDDVPLTADVAKMLDLPYHSPEGARAARSKFVTRQIMKAKGLPTPLFQRVDTAQDLEDAIKTVGFPAVLKPAFGASAAFVVRVNDADEARAAFQRVEREMTTDVESALSHGRMLVLEQYLQGPEYDVDIVMQAGKAKFVSVTDNWPTKEPYFLATGSSLPSVLPKDHQAEIESLAVKTAEALGLTDGVIHIEGKYTKDGARIVEANGRMGGVYVRDWVKAVWGVDLVDETAFLAAGIPSAPFKPAKPLAHLEGEFLIPENSGKLTAFDLAAAAQLAPGFHELRRMIGVGSEIKVPPHGYDRVGMLVARGASNAEARKSLDALRANLDLQVTPYDKK